MSLVNFYFIEKFKQFFFGEEPTQYDFVEYWIKDIVAEAARLHQDLGSVLVWKLPSPMFDILPDTDFNPVGMQQEVSLHYWLIDHIYFGKDGVPMVLHDHGRLVWAGRHFNESAWLQHKRYHYG